MLTDGGLLLVIVRVSGGDLQRVSWYSLSSVLGGDCQGSMLTVVLVSCWWCLGTVSYTHLTLPTNAEV